MTRRSSTSRHESSTNLHQDGKTGRCATESLTPALTPGRCRLLQAGGAVPLRALSRPIPELGGRDRIGPSLTQLGGSFARCAHLGVSLTQGSLQPSLRYWGKL